MPRVSSAGASRSRKSPFAIILNQFILVPQTAPTPVFIPFLLFSLLGLVSLCHVVSVVFTEGDAEQPLQSCSWVKWLALLWIHWGILSAKVLIVPSSWVLTSVAQLLPGYVWLSQERKRLASTKNHLAHSVDNAVFVKTTWYSACVVCKHLLITCLRAPPLGSLDVLVEINPLLCNWLCHG